MKFSRDDVVFHIAAARRQFMATRLFRTRRCVYLLVVAFYDFLNSFKTRKDKLPKNDQKKKIKSEIYLGFYSRLKMIIILLIILLMLCMGSYLFNAMNCVQI